VTSLEQGTDSAGSETRRRGETSSKGGAKRRKTAAKPSRKKVQKTKAATGAGDSNKGMFFNLCSLADVRLPDLTDQRCWECKLPLTHPKHLTGVYACKKCRYTTSCEKIYPVHRRVFHSTGVAPLFSMGAPIELTTPLFCSCGFSSGSGNRLAAHMTGCECRTATPGPRQVKQEPAQTSDAPNLPDQAEELETLNEELDLAAKDEPMHVEDL